MTPLELGLAIACGVISALLFVACAALAFVGAFAVRYGKMALAWEESIADSLDVLDECHRDLSRVLSTPLFANSPEVRDLIARVKEARDAVLFVANAMTIPTGARERPSR